METVRRVVFLCSKNALRNTHNKHTLDRYSQFRRLHREIQKSFGWQFDQCQAEFPAKTFFNDVSPAFNETRKEALNDYFKRVRVVFEALFHPSLTHTNARTQVRTIPKIMEFDKHHSCVALRDFVEYANHCDKKVETSPRRSSTVSSNNNSGSSRGLRSSRNRYSSRRGMRSSVGSRPQSSSPQAERPTRQVSEDSVEEPPSSSSSSDDPRFAPYKKMLNMHLPEGAVRHKMSASGFTDQEIDSFLGGGDTSSSNGVSSSSSSSSVRDDPRFAKFTKMLQMHLPMGAIRHKMSASGFTDAEIEAFASNTSVSSSSTNSRPAPPRPAPKKRPTPAKRPAPTKRRAPAPRGGGSSKGPAAAPGNLLASIQGFNKKKLKKKGPPKKKKPGARKPAKNSMAAVLQAKLKARSMRLRKRESSHEVKRAALASRKRVESARRSSFASSSSNDDW